MSEKEKLQRSAYQQHRRKMIIRIAVVVALLTAILLGVGIRFLQAGGNNYISYTESGNAIYKAYLKDNKFYSEEYLNGSHAYVAALVDRMTADFSYDFTMTDAAVRCSYRYQINAQLCVRDKQSKMDIFNPVYELKSGEEKISAGNTISIRESVALDYNAYNKTAKSFIKTYDLNDVEAFLAVCMTVKTSLEGNAAAAGGSNTYTITVHIPLNQTTVAPYVETPPVSDERKLLAANSRDLDLYKTLTILFAVADVLAAAWLAVYVIVTRDQHIDYARRVGKILSAYRSFIQKVNNPLDTQGYQVLQVDSFPELLEIRDTLQSPVLMYENEDQTCTEFFVLSSGIQYIYKIAVEDSRFGGKYSVKQAAEMK